MINFKDFLNHSDFSASYDSGPSRNRAKTGALIPFPNPNAEPQVSSLEVACLVDKLMMMEETQEPYSLGVAPSDPYEVLAERILSEI